MSLDIFYYVDMNFGAGLLDSATRRYLYIDIPKNASSSMKELLSDDWGEVNHMLDESVLLNSDEIIVILRNPLERWISAINQYFQANLRTPNIDMSSCILRRIIFETIQFDIHTVPQSTFLFGMQRYISKCVFFMCDDNLTKNINNYLCGKQSNNKLNIPHLHKTPSNTAFGEYVLNNKEYLEKVKNYYHRDYALIDSVNFYTS